MTTHDQTARNAEIVQRRLNGEATGALALEYGMSPTRIGQLVRRHREKAGEIPAKPRTKATKAETAIRPRLRKVELGLWECFDAAMSRRGETPREAYDRWLRASLIELFDKQLAPHAAKASKAPEPAELEQPYRGPVTVVPGVRPGQALRLPQSLLLNGARARAAQPYTPSLSGGRRGDT
ncbi:hypothetical protein [Achromobacter insolitus]|uniref:Uncharacterized protein n=1 Tax=Achromobacter insolitus TaxID=217204 RepID=A0A6S7F812_9BURK|nr:hypothetical protein [Achromobacter insolitus]CAB3931616.1 hypothetical protein LMG6000_02243 [Achromobacter insolitus]CAB3939487.1 hypothetical protein LMG5997_04060 [Achromobacter insolitus]